MDVLVQVLMVWFDLVYFEWIAVGLNMTLAEVLFLLAVVWLEVFVQGGHRPGKHGKPGKLREFEKLSKSQGKLMKI